MCVREGVKCQFTECLCVCEIMASSLVDVLESADGFEITGSIDDVGSAGSEGRMKVEVAI